MPPGVQELVQGSSALVARPAPALFADFCRSEVLAELPKGARMVVWTITNVEEWDPTAAMPRTVLTPPAGGSPIPDIPNWCWHEYGNRVGFWRLLQVYDDFKIPGVMNINGTAALAFPDIVKACVDRKWEFLGHGPTQKNMQKVANERDDIRACAAAIEKAAGKVQNAVGGLKDALKR